MKQRTLRLNAVDLRLKRIERTNDEESNQGQMKPIEKKKIMGFREFTKSQEAASARFPQTNDTERNER
jgi:hypothetical protein